MNNNILKSFPDGDFIRKSTEIDIVEIHRWLLTQEKNEIDDSFLCNWNIVTENHNSNELIVYISNGHAIAFQLGGLLSPGILEVKNDKRKMGIGKRIVKYCINQAIENNICALHIQCKPSKSIPFWQAMGFTVITSNNSNFFDDNHAYMALNKKLTLPVDGARISIAIKVYPLSREWDRDNTVAIESYKVLGVKNDNNGINLSERIVVTDGGEIKKSGRFVIEAKSNEKMLFSTRAKYCEHGVQRGENAFYIEQINDKPVEAKCLK